MNSGIYTAFSGLRAQMDALDIMANNLANANTTGFKEENAFYTVLDQSLNQAQGPLDAAVNSSVSAQSALNTAAGSLRLTNRDLDVALEGDGFLSVQTPAGIRYTRNGSLQVNKQSVLSTADGFPVLGATGQPITVSSGKISIDQQGQVSVDGSPVDRLKVVSFEKPASLQKEGSSLFAAPAGGGQDSNSKVLSGYLEESNVNSIAAVVRLVEINKRFEALEKTVDLVMNDINAKSIDKLGGS